jgi:hypothetical protein
MLQEAQTGDASLGERIAQEQGISVPEGTKSGSKITEQVVPSEIYKEEKEPYDPNIGEIGFGMPGAGEGLEMIGNYIADKTGSFLDDQLKYNYSDPEINDA